MVEQKKVRKQQRKWEERADDLRMECRENKFSTAAEGKTMRHNGDWIGGQTLK